MNNLGSRIKLLRKKKGLSQNDLSNKILNRVVLSRIENNIQEPSLNQIIHICTVLEISLDELILSKPYTVSICSKDSIDYILNLYNRNNFYDITKYYDLNKSDFVKIKNSAKFFYLGYSYYKINLYKESERFLKKYVNFVKKNEQNLLQDNIINLCVALNSIFRIHMALNDSKKAIKHLKLAEIYISKFNMENTNIGQSILSNIATFYLRENQYKKVISYCYNFENLQTDVCYPLVIVNIYKALAISYYNIGNYKKSIHNTQKVIDLYSFLGDDYNKGVAYFNYINALMYSTKHDEALYLIENCKNQYKDVKDLFNTFLVQEMSVYFNMSKFHKVLDVSLSVNQKYLSKDFLCDFNFIIGHINHLAGNKNTAIKNLKFCESLFINKRCNYDLYVVYGDLHILTNDDSFKEKQRNLTYNSMKKNIIIDLNKIPE